MVGPPRHLPSAAGRLLAGEIEALGGLLEPAARPFVALLGGSKVSDKIGVIDALLDRCDLLLVGGAMASTFLAAQGFPVGDSLVELDQVEQCRSRLDTGKVSVPTDAVIAKEMEPDALGGGGGRRRPRRLEDPRRRPRHRHGLLRRGGPGRDGVLERAHGRVRDPGLRRRDEGRGRGGGVVRGVHRRRRRGQRRGPGKFGLADRVSHLSTGGGASLEYLEQGDLPGLRALREGKR